MNSKIQVVYCADLDVSYGLLISLASLIENTNSSIKISIITDKERPVSANHVKALRLKYPYVEIEIIPIDTLRFHELPPLVESRFPYAKLLIPEVCHVSKVIYIDVDTIVDVDISSLLGVELGSNSILAKPVYSMKESLEKLLFKNLKISEDLMYCNTGVLVMNLDMLRKSNFSRRAIKFGKANSDQVLTADQSIINAMLYKEIGKLPANYNNQVNPNSELIPIHDYEKGIFHFVGAPKPWDPLARLFLSHFGIWREYERKNPDLFLFRPKLNKSSMFRILKYIFRTLKKGSLPRLYFRIYKR
jgi:lipopolysaccharide biosynthesis glycosyltransferase